MRRGTLRATDSLDPEATMTAAQFERFGEDEAEDILRWRFQSLARAGYEAGTAARLAAQVQIDLHEACNLVRGGCPPETALRILL